MGNPARSSRSRLRPFVPAIAAAVALGTVGVGISVANSTTAHKATKLATPTFSLTPGPSSVTVNFSSVAHASSYSAQECNSVGASCAAAVTVTPGSYSFTGLAATTTYTIELRAIGNGKTYLTSPTGSKTATTGVLNIAPTTTIGGANTQLSYDSQVAVGRSGTVYATNVNSSSVTSYAPGRSGNVAPKTDIIGSSTGLSAPQGVGVDATGRLYISQPNGSVLGFPKTATGNVAPKTTLTGLGNATALAFDSSNNLYVSQSPSGPIDVFAPGHRNGAEAPFRTVPRGIYGIATDASNNLYVANYGQDSISVYAAGTATLIRTISGSNTGLSGPNSVGLDGSGRLYVTNTGTNQISVFAPGANGNATPIAVIGGSNVGIAYIGNLAVSPGGSIYVATNYQDSIPIFGPLFTP